MRKLGVDAEIVTIKARVNAHIRRELNDTVGYGPLKGMQISPEISWGGNDIASKLLGQYECHVVERLIKLAKPGRDLIDIGAADGFFAVGAVRAGLFDRCICFEQSEAGQRAIKATAQLNGVSDSVIVYGLANEASVEDALRLARDPVILCDIEGGEFEVLSETLLAKVANSDIIVELHDPFIADGERKKRELLARAAAHFDIEIFHGAPVPVNDFVELKDLPDDYRLLAFSEDRQWAMEWLQLSRRNRDI